MRLPLSKRRCSNAPAAMPAAPGCRPRLRSAQWLPGLGGDPGSRVPGAGGPDGVVRTGRRRVPIRPCVPALPGFSVAEALRPWRDGRSAPEARDCRCRGRAGRVPAELFERVGGVHRPALRSYVLPGAASGAAGPRLRRRPAGSAVVTAAAGRCSRVSALPGFPAPLGLSASPGFSAVAVPHLPRCGGGSGAGVGAVSGRCGVAAGRGGASGRLSVPFFRSVEFFRVAGHEAPQSRS